MIRIALALAIIAVALGTEQSGAAQVATPAVEGCTIAPISLERLQALAAQATPVAGPTPTVPAELPAGEPAGYDGVVAFTKTIQLLVDCLNEGLYWQSISVYSDRYIASSIIPFLGELSEASYAAQATPHPVRGDQQTEILGIGEIVQTPDGRLAGVVTAVIGGSATRMAPTLFYLALQNDGWHIDEFFLVAIED
jgi:hypothetical protein